MTEIVNLRRFRKAKARSQAAAVADQNRARHGRSTVERRAEESEAARLRAGLDGHLIEKPRSRRDVATDG